MLKLYVNNRGWVMGLVRDKHEKVCDLRFTKHKEGAKSFTGDWNICAEAYDALYFIENTLKCNVDKVRCYA